ncbi:MAG: hypothetical protein SOR92_08250, partial [Christensenella hongkongensis]|uniref:hypothetical protein n=1 Tax=Christensenella hongkongensis TaxID=270498 RepID=UPI002A74E049
RPFVDSNPKGFLKQDGQLYCRFVHVMLLLIGNRTKKGQPRRQVTDGTGRARTTNRDCVSIFALYGAIKTAPAKPIVNRGR